VQLVGEEEEEEEEDLFVFNDTVEGPRAPPVGSRSRFSLSCVVAQLCGDGRQMRKRMQQHLVVAQCCRWEENKKRKKLGPLGGEQEEEEARTFQ